MPTIHPWESFPRQRAIMRKTQVSLTILEPAGSQQNCPYLQHLSLEKLSMLYFSCWLVVELKFISSAFSMHSLVTDLHFLPSPDHFSIHQEFSRLPHFLPINDDVKILISWLLVFVKHLLWVIWSHKRRLKLAFKGLEWDFIQPYRSSHKASLCKDSVQNY